MAWIYPPRRYAPPLLGGDFSTYESIVNYLDLEVGLNEDETPHPCNRSVSVLGFARKSPPRRGARRVGWVPPQPQPTN